MGQVVRKLLYGDNDIYDGAPMLPYCEFMWGDKENNAAIFKECITEIKPNLIVEVGSWVGGSAIMMAEIVKEQGLDTEIVCIDTWLGSVEHLGEQCTMNQEHGRPTIYRDFMSNVIQAGFQDIITPFSMDSINALLFLKKQGILADIVYLDAGHDQMSVKGDLYNASNILRVDGVLLGDDWHHPDVRAAVFLMFGMAFIRERGNKYIWIK